MDDALTLSSVTKIFHDGRIRITAVEDVSFSVARGEFFVLLGPSGSGKSTLLRLASGLEKSYRGTISFAGDITRADLSFVFQQFAVWPWLTVSENVETGLIARHVSPGKCRERVRRELERLGLAKFAQNYPRELSGGMRQRVGIARALATDPKILFMDEAFSELDSFTAAVLRKEILDIWQETRVTVVMVTHLIEEAVELSDRIAVLTSRPGRVEEIVTNPLPRPRARRSKSFFDLEDRLYALVAPEHASP